MDSVLKFMWEFEDHLEAEGSTVSAKEDFTPEASMAWASFQNLRREKIMLKSSIYLSLLMGMLLAHIKAYQQNDKICWKCG